MSVKSFGVEGMTCASCAQTVEKTAGKLPGVETAAVNLATEKLSLNYNKTILNDEDISKAIEEAGYKVASNEVKKTLNNEGMTCSSCAQTVEKAVQNIQGVSVSNVNLATEKLTVSYDPSVLNL